MKRKFLILFLMVFSIFMISSVNAEDINSFYANAEQNVKMVDKVIGDSALAGALVDIDGQIEGIGFIAGQTVNVNGNLDYGFIAGQNVKVIGKINRNAYIAGSTIEFTKDASVGRDTKIVGETINLSGRFERDVDLAGTKVVLNDETIIDNNITINADEIVIAGNVTIDGTLKYNDNAKIDIKDSAAIKNIEKFKNSTKEKKVNTKDLVLSIINLIVVLLIFALLLPKAMDKTDEVYEDKKFNTYAKNFAIGILFIICVPIVSIILLASNIGTYLGLIILAIYIIALYLAYGLAGYVFGNLIFNRALKLNINRYLIIIMGIILIKLLALIPVLGGLVVIVSVAVGMATLWELVKERTDKKEITTPVKSESAKIKEKTKVSAPKTTNKKSTTKKSTTPKKSTTTKKSTTKKTQTKK